MQAEEVEQSNADKLRYYLRSERNRSKYWQEIADLVGKDSSLLALYPQEMVSFTPKHTDNGYARLA